MIDINISKCFIFSVGGVLLSRWGAGRVHDTVPCTSGDLLHQVLVTLYKLIFLCYLTIKSDTEQHSQFLQCFYSEVICIIVKKTKLYLWPIPWFQLVHLVQLDPRVGGLPQQARWQVSLIQTCLRPSRSNWQCLHFCRISSPKESDRGWWQLESKLERGRVESLRCRSILRSVRPYCVPYSAVSRPN